MRTIEKQKLNNALSEEEIKEAAIKELGEDPKQVEEGVKTLRDWINKSPHLQNIKKDDWTLSSFLRGCKYSLERTKEKLDFHFAVRGNLPDWFDQWDPNQEIIQTIMKNGSYLPLPGYDKKGRAVILMRGGVNKPGVVKMEQMFKVSTMLIELFMHNNLQAQVKGMVLIQDMEGMTAQHALEMNPAMAKRAMTVWQDAYPAKPKALHFINMPSIMESIFAMVQSFQKEKMKARNIVHPRGSLALLHEDLGTDILPAEYGGTNSTVKELTEYWLEEVQANRDWLLEQTRYKTEEKKRPGKPKSHADIFGIEGSFRKLEID